MDSPTSSPGNTRTRLLEAAEVLFIEHGYEGMSLRQITSGAEVNLAAVNYHFGSKEALLQELLSARLDRLNQERLQLLSLCEAHCGERGMDACAVLSVLFVPAVRLSRDGSGGVAFMRLLGRVYSDPSPFIRDYLHEHYQPIYGRFFEAFSRALPHMSRSELGMRLHFCLKALSGVLADENMDELTATICMGEAVDDSRMLARLISFISPMLTTPFEDSGQVRDVGQVMAMADRAAEAADAQMQADGDSAQGRRSKNGPSPWTARAAGI